MKDGRLEHLKNGGVLACGSEAKTEVMTMKNVLRQGEIGIAYVIGSLAAFWLFERTFSFWV